MSEPKPLRGDLLKYMKEMKNRQQAVSSTPIKRFPDPIGWTSRERFGTKLRYWPRMSELFTLDESTMASRGIPRMYMKYYIDEVEPKDVWQAQVMNYMNIIYTVRSNPLPCLTVIGGNGSGKTLLGCALVNTVTRLSGCIDHKTGNTDDWNPYFVNEADLLSRIEGYSRSGVDWFREYSEESRLLVIDEFGMTQWTATDTRRMNQLLNKRFGNGLQTVILTNLPISKLLEVLSDQLRSRFKMGKSIVMSSQDYRPKYEDTEYSNSIDEDDPDFDPFAGR